jgi:hypothetical protein
MVKLYKESFGSSSLLTVIMMPLSKWEVQSGEPYWVGRICQNNCKKTRRIGIEENRTKLFLEIDYTVATP